MDLDRLTFNQDRLESPYAQAAPCTRAIQQHWMFANPFFEDVPNARLLPLDHLACLLDRRRVPLLLELVVDEWLEQLERHLLWQTTLMQLQLRPDNDHRSPGVVDTLAEEILTKAPLFAFQCSGQRFKRTIVDAAQNAAATAVVEQRVDRFLQHALLLPDNNFSRPQIHQLLQTLVAIDYASIEIVQVGSGKTSAIQRYQRAQLGRNHRYHIQDHPIGMIAGLKKRSRNLQALGKLQLLLLRRFFAHAAAQFYGQPFHVHHPQQFFDRFGAHRAHKFRRIVTRQLTKALISEQLAFRQFLHIAGIDHDVRLEVEDFLQLAQRNIEQVPDARRQTFEEPNV